MEELRLNVNFGVKSHSLRRMGRIPFGARAARLTRQSCFSARTELEATIPNAPAGTVCELL
jgi:hypothetical protein